MNSKFFALVAQQVEHSPFKGQVARSNRAKRNFLYLTVKLGLLASDNALQVKAVSQNLGHEHVATTLNQYSTLRPEQLKRAIQKLNYKNVTDNFNKWTDYYQVILNLD